jgi:peptidoglycan hydrolase-like protein with peptidoglycan-binding domain
VAYRRGTRWQHAGYSDYISAADSAETAAQDASPTERYGNFGLKVNGIFGSQTYNAVIAFQRAHGLKPNLQ